MQCMYKLKVPPPHSLYMYMYLGGMSCGVQCHKVFLVHHVDFPLTENGSDSNEKFLREVGHEEPLALVDTQHLGEGLMRETGV